MARIAAHPHYMSVVPASPPPAQGEVLLSPNFDISDIPSPRRHRHSPEALEVLGYIVRLSYAVDAILWWPASPRSVHPISRAVLGLLGRIPLDPMADDTASHAYIALRCLLLDGEEIGLESFGHTIERIRDRLPAYTARQIMAILESDGITTTPLADAPSPTSSTR